MPNSALGPNRTEQRRRFLSPLSPPDASHWRTSFWLNLRDFLAAPACGTHAPSGVSAAATWPARGHLNRAQGLSLAFHGTLIALLLIPAAQQFGPNPKPPGEQLIFPISPLKPVVFKRGSAIHGGGASGNHQPEPPTVGKPTPFSWLQLTPPRLNPEASARLQAEATVIGPPDLRLPDLPYLNPGDPSRTALNRSQGPGEGGAFGDKPGHGVGSGNGDGQGPGEKWGTGNVGLPAAGRNGVGEPVCVYCPNPQFTDEAVKTRFQGSVVLRLVVTEEGKPANISIIRGVGMGLDQKALEAVRTWRFQPARGPNHQPVAAWVTIEVMFRQF